MYVFTQTVLLTRTMSEIGEARAGPNFSVRASFVKELSLFLVWCFSKIKFESKTYKFVEMQ